ncbi:TM2 domain-containing protein [Gracilimonas sp.]|uniref:TM2 domain-containing protein n=1 Tax=Gracilimonas sp. TaxID=1974203 RepID=UPI0025C617C7|nr:TM2 domain-containing protein [Gracilimonas sp.]
MRKAEKYEMALVAEKALDKAFQKYEEVISELKEEKGYTETNLSISIYDSLRNLSRKVEAYLEGKIQMDKLVDEFVFEYEVVEGELEIEKAESVRMKKLAKRILFSYKDFIGQVGGNKKMKLLTQNDSVSNSYEIKSKGKAYLFWFVGFFGILGLHRFYLGRTGTGIGWLLSGGVMGLGALYDLFALSRMVEEQNMYNELRAAKLKQLTEGKS